MMEDYLKFKDHINQIREQSLYVDGLKDCREQDIVHIIKQVTLGAVRTRYAKNDKLQDCGYRRSFIDLYKICRYHCGDISLQTLIDSISAVREDNNFGPSMLGAMYCPTVRKLVFFRVGGINRHAHILGVNMYTLSTGIRGCKLGSLIDFSELYDKQKNEISNK